MSHTKPYALTVDTRAESPTHQMVQDVVDGTIDVGFLWGPIAGYYHKHDDLPLTLIPLKDEPGAARVADDLGTRRATGFARGDCLEAFCLQRRRQALHLRGFAGALAAFECDEAACQDYFFFQRRCTEPIMRLKIPCGPTACAA